MIFLKKKSQEILSIKVPRHIAIIMDGNHRFAKSKNLPTKFGHKEGVKNIEKIAKVCIEFGVKYLTVYAFSSENWQRPKDEVLYLMKLLDEYLSKEVRKLSEENIKILVSGNLEKLASATKQRILAIQEETKNNSSLTLNVAFSYGGRQEIVDAAKKIVVAVDDGKIKFDEIDEKLFAKNLYQSSIPDPDLLIRTAGDFRVSNFLLWQIAYTEFYFTEKFWPDFSKQDLKKAIIEYNKRERKYGKRM
jgi:undecaprenyl diphosphate synthase